MASIRPYWEVTHSKIRRKAGADERKGESDYLDTGRGTSIPDHDNERALPAGLYKETQKNPSDRKEELG